MLSRDSYGCVQACAWTLLIKERNLPISDKNVIKFI